MASLHVLGKDCTSWGTRTVFDVARDGTRVPAALWAPTGVEQPAVVLLGHGGGAHKLTDRHEHFATRLAREADVACLAIDAPWHGDRAVEGVDFRELMVAAGPARVQQQTTREWLAALDAVACEGLVNGDYVGYVGLSLGSVFGFPVCAALGDRLRGTVLGKVGTTCASHLTDIASPTVMATAAAAINAPTLFQMQWDDEIFPRQQQLDLFDLIAAQHKTLRAHPGRHADTWPDDEHAWLDHVRLALRP